MEQDGLWQLFFLTGLPEAYLAIRGTEMACQEELPDSLTAFGRVNRKETKLL